LASHARRFILPEESCRSKWGSTASAASDEYYARVAGNAAIEFVAVNDVTDSKTRRTCEYDSVLWNLHQNVTHTAGFNRRGRKKFPRVQDERSGEIDWASVGAEIVIESTGLFTKAPDAAKHKRGPVKKVIISAPAVART